MVLEELRAEVCDANRALVRHGLVTLTWGNVSGICPDRRRIVIKPSGVPYGQLEPADMVVVDLDGEVVEGDLRPSSDTPTHVLLYRNFDGIGGITHNHGRHATAFAQARREIPCLGTTHADHFRGPVPVTRPLREDEVEGDYEVHTGTSIVERFLDLDPLEVPGVLVAGHAPFTWGATVAESLANAVALEAIAAMALDTLAIDSTPPELERHVADKHYRRKHGDDAYYGQQESEES